jgi:hypothetical protein
MDPIFVNNSSIQSHHKPGAKSELSSTKTKDSAPNQAIPPRAELTDIPSLANASLNSGPDLRPDALARAEKLLNDPDWLSDSNLDALAERLITQEDL